MAMFIVHADSVFKVAPGTPPDYNSGNPLLRLLDLVAKTRFAAERQAYLQQHLQYLFPYDSLEMYGPQGGDADVTDPAKQDNKTDFQKQNVKEFRITDTYLARGWVTAGDWTGPFLKLSYRGGPDSKLSQAANHHLGPSIRLFLKVRDAATATPLTVPYNEESHRYEIELWGYPGNDLGALVEDKGRASIARGELVARPDLVRGLYSDFAREGLDDQFMTQVHPENTMHPILPLHVEAAWSDVSGAHYDSLDGANYQYEFDMIVRGWDNYIGVGLSLNPHGGVGLLHYRNLLSNYGRYSGMKELGRQIEPWMFDAFGKKAEGERYENFFSIDYMDLHILMNNCGIGLHRHRDNQEVFFMVDGQGLMVVGDWCKFPQRERCFEIRTLRSGHFAMLKGGNLHGLYNSTDVDIFLFMFGGYD
ncbi:MAG: cupin domain-containing protein [Isosphaeraceae bacterium]